MCVFLCVLLGLSANKEKDRTLQPTVFRFMDLFTYMEFFFSSFLGGQKFRFSKLRFAELFLLLYNIFFECFPHTKELFIFFL